MKFKTTQKQIKNNYGKVFAVGYCGIADLLRFEEPRAYTCGVYGWNADVYTFGDVAIITGYRPFGKNIPSELQREYNEQAYEIMHNQGGVKGLTYEERRELVQKLLAVFIQELRKL